MKQKIYLESGFFNFNYALERNIPFNFIWGARGTGKTYGAITTLVQLREPFIYLRRTQIQADTVMNPKLSPFKVPLDDLGIKYTVEKLEKNSYAVYGHDQDQEGHEKEYLISIVLALSTVSNVRGFDGTDFNYTIFDEFIPETHARPIRNEADAFFNFVETVNRNRELQDREPMKVYCLSNSDNIACPIFVHANLLESVLGMTINAEQYRYLPERAAALYQLLDSPISDRKKDTALYKLTAGTSFQAMAINNQFTNTSTKCIKSMNLKSLIPIIDIGEIMIYRTKDKRTFYVSPHKMTGKYTFTTSDSDLDRFRASYGFLWFDYLNYHVFFENYTSEIIFKAYFKQV